MYTDQKNMYNGLETSHIGMHARFKCMLEHIVWCISNCMCSYMTLISPDVNFMLCTLFSSSTNIYVNIEMKLMPGKKQECVTRYERDVPPELKRLLHIFI
jgi:hypothetical protein